MDTYVKVQYEYCKRKCSISGLPVVFQLPPLYEVSAAYAVAFMCGAQVCVSFAGGLW